MFLTTDTIHSSRVSYQNGTKAVSVPLTAFARDKKEGKPLTKDLSSLAALREKNRRAEGL